MFADKFTKIVPHLSKRTAFGTTALVVFIFLAGSFPAEAGRPKAPSNFRVTARTAYTVSLAWDPAPPNGGNFTYRLSGAYNVGPTVILPQNATTYTYSALFPGNTYWFSIYTQNASGQTSSQLNLSTTTLLDTTPPSTAPAISITDTGSNYSSFTWTAAQDDGPYLFYEVWVNGSLTTTTARNVQSTTLRFLQPETTYTVAVRAYDYGNNRGPFSSPVSITTLPPNPNDHIPPTTPADLRAETYGGGDTEIHLFWTQSTDNFDAQTNIRYDVYVNNVFQDVLFGSGGPSIVYGEFGQNTIQVIASDTAGNASAPATITVFF